MARVKQRRPGAGFAALKEADPVKLKAVAASGGRAAHAKGTAYEWSSNQARDAAAKSVAARRAKKTNGGSTK